LARLQAVQLDGPEHRRARSFEGRRGVVITQGEQLGPGGGPIAART
jgi:hypothetical protein